jgi:hypothetical protein
LASAWLLLFGSSPHCNNVSFYVNNDELQDPRARSQGGSDSATKHSQSPLRYIRRVAKQEVHFRLLDLTRLSKLCLTSSFGLAEKPPTIDCMGDWIFSRTSMVITHLTADDYLLARFALTKNPCYNVVVIRLRAENIRRSSLSYMPTPPNFKDLGQSSSLAARTKKVDRKDRALLKLKFLVYRTLRMPIENSFSTSQS